MHLTAADKVVRRHSQAGQAAFCGVRCNSAAVSYRKAGRAFRSGARSSTRSAIILSRSAISACSSRSRCPRDFRAIRHADVTSRQSVRSGRHPANVRINGIPVMALSGVQRGAGALTLLSLISCTATLPAKTAVFRQLLTTPRALVMPSVLLGVTVRPPEKAACAASMAAKVSPFRRRGRSGGVPGPIRALVCKPADFRHLPFCLCKSHRLPGQDSRATKRQALPGSHAPFRRNPLGPVFAGHRRVRGKTQMILVDQGLGQQTWKTLRYQRPLQRPHIARKLAGAAGLRPHYYSRCS